MKKKFLAKGKRGYVYTALYKGKKVAIKEKNPKSKAIARIDNEARFMKLLNKHEIGPRFVQFENDSLMYVFVDGIKILDYIAENRKMKIVRVLRKVFRQMYKMDKLGINKEEMHHPVKHILVEKNKPVLIDFERCSYTEKSHNVTQFSQFIMSMKDTLKKKGININKKKIIKHAKTYSHDISWNNFNKLVNVVME